VSEERIVLTDEERSRFRSWAIHRHDEARKLLGHAGATPIGRHLRGEIAIYYGIVQILSAEKESI
jgi:hypothetical protein